jgi:hypothetical protein
MRSIGYLICGVVLVGGLLRAEVGEAATYYVATNFLTVSSLAIHSLFAGGPIIPAKLQILLGATAKGAVLRLPRILARP